MRARCFHVARGFAGSRRFTRSTSEGAHHDATATTTKRRAAGTRESSFTNRSDVVPNRNPEPTRTGTTERR